MRLAAHTLFRFLAIVPFAGIVCTTCLSAPQAELSSTQSEFQSNTLATSLEQMKYLEEMRSVYSEVKGFTKKKPEQNQATGSLSNAIRIRHPGDSHIQTS